MVVVVVVIVVFVVVVVVVSVAVVVDVVDGQNWVSKRLDVVDVVVVFLWWKE